MLAGLPNAPFRVLVRQGIRLDRMAPLNKRVLDGYRRRFGFDWAMRRLGRKAPRVQTSRPVAPVSLLEVWAHHEDVIAANGRRCGSGVDLSPVVRVLVRYQRHELVAHGVRLTTAGTVSADTVWHEPAETRVHIDGEVDDVARWLAGRGSLSALTSTGEAPVVSALAAARFRI
jgi:hypothetical protein